jgi:hypothetical protein
VPGASAPLVELLLPEVPQLAIPIARQTTTSMRASATPRRLVMNNIPIIENGTSAKKIGFDPNCTGIKLAEPPLPPVVLMDTFTGEVVVPSITSEFGETVHVEPDGPEHANFMVSLKLLTGATERL